MASMWDDNREPLAAPIAAAQAAVAHLPAWTSRPPLVLSLRVRRSACGILSHLVCAKLGLNATIRNACWITTICMDVTINNDAKSRLTQIPNEVWITQRMRKPVLVKVEVQ